MNVYGMCMYHSTNCWTIIHSSYVTDIVSYMKIHLCIDSTLSCINTIQMVKILLNDYAIF